MKLNQLFEGINDKGLLKAIFMAGTPGAGKSYTIKKITADVQPRIVNTDKFIEFLANKAGKKMKGEEFEEFFKAIDDDSQRLTKSQLKLYLNGMLPLFIDSTSSRINNVVMRAGILESMGYDVGMIFVHSDIETSIKRISQRDRDVRRDFVEQCYKVADDNRRFYKTKFDMFMEINNSEGALTDDVMNKVFKKTERFFTGSLSNPIGRRTLEKLKETGGKELVPTIISMEELDKKLDVWYRT